MFYKYPRVPAAGEFCRYVRLGFGGPVLCEDDRDCGLLVLDGTWRHVRPMERFFSDVPIRSLPPIQTAYPRTSKVRIDPDGGLATIEAIYAAFRILKRDASGLLDHYHWAEDFVLKNSDVWPRSEEIVSVKSPVL